MPIFSTRVLTYLRCIFRLFIGMLLTLALAGCDFYHPSSQLEQIRQRGLHFVHGLLMPGVDALSAPVFNAVGQVAAVMTVVGPTSLFHADEDGPAAQQLLAYLSKS